MKLYFTPGTCALADHIVLAWIGKPYEAQKVPRDERQQPWFLKLNPDRKSTRLNSSHLRRSRMPSSA